MENTTYHFILHFNENERHPNYYFDLYFSFILEIEGTVFKFYQLHQLLFGSKSKENFVFGCKSVRAPVCR